MQALDLVGAGWKTRLRSRRLLTVSERRRNSVTVFNTGFNNCSRKPLGDFDRLGHISPLRYKTRNVGTGSDVTALVQRFHVQAN
jgi:hypothetical protein